MDEAQPSSEQRRVNVPSGKNHGQQERRQEMKRLWIAALLVGIVLLFATATQYGISNIIGLILFAVSAYKLGLFNKSDSEDYE